MVGSTTLTAAGARAPRDTPSSSKRRVGRLDLGNFSFPKGLYANYILRSLRRLIEEKRQKGLIRDFTTTPLPIPKIFLVVYLLKLSSECLVSYDPHFPGNDGK